MIRQELYTLITGATSGIGSRIALRLASDRRLILHGRDEQKLTELRGSCERPEDHLLWACDLANVAGISTSLTDLLKKDGSRVGALVHCAGVVHLRAFRLTSAEREWEMFNINFFSAVETIRCLRCQNPNEALLKNIVLISSGSSLVGEKGNSLYTATKGALDAFMKSLAIELAPGARVNSLLPGMVDAGMSTPILASPGYDDVIRVNYPLGIGHGDDIAGAVHFLLSEEARWITGQQIVVDGGFSAHSNHAN
jgi:NAD(P)-dependent dehydrogenase (short-subunit alcohol dehydrogenase family)